jgi:hypothetical protein
MQEELTLSLIQVVITVSGLRVHLYTAERVAVPAIGLPDSGAIQALKSTSCENSYFSTSKERVACIQVWTVA